LSQPSKSKAADATKKVDTIATRGEPKLSEILHVFDDPRIRREYVEMAVFTMVLVCFLRLFGAEAYMIPSGSMGPTLMGANKVGVCPECGHINLVNARGEAEDGHVVNEGLCQNCQHSLVFRKGEYDSGDRVLVDKLEAERQDPERWDVVVFKYPDGVDGDRNGQVRSARTNFIKRLIGMPEETVGIEFGDIFIRDDKTPGAPFEISRKPARAVMSMRRLVWDNDRQPKDLAKEGAPRRWVPSPGSVFEPSADHTSFDTEASPKENWIEYRHILRTSVSGLPEPKVGLINDFEAYNTDNYHNLGYFALGENWVGDLMVECDATPAAKAGVITAELIDGAHVYRAVFDLAAGSVKLVADEKEVAQAEAPFSANRSRQIRFANVNDRLILWMDGYEVFGDGIDVPSPKREERGPTVADLRPVRLGARDVNATFAGIKIFRDVYYTRGGRQRIVRDVERAGGFVRITEPEQIDSYRNLLLAGEMRTFSIPKDHYFCMGDNSPHSADGRDWTRTHFVERHLMLGRAVVRYWPAVRFEGNWPVLNWKFVE
jgi:signal peptidase I